MVDYKKLLEQYLETVRSAEGTHFLDEFFSWYFLSESEKEAVLSLIKDKNG